jgi:hypothetical protein
MISLLWIYLQIRNCWVFRLFTWSSIVKNLENTMVEKVQEHSNFECYTQFSEPIRIYVDILKVFSWPPLWASGQISWLQIQRPEFYSWRYLRSSRPGTGSTQPRAYTWGAILKEKVAADYATPLDLQKWALPLPTSGGRLFGIVCSRTQATEFVCFSW